MHAAICGEAASGNKFLRYHPCMACRRRDWGSGDYLKQRLDSSVVSQLCLYVAPVASQKLHLASLSHGLFPTSSHAPPIVAPHDGPAKDHFVRQQGRHRLDDPESQFVPVSIFHRALLILLKVTAASARLWTSPFKRQRGAHNYFKDVLFQLMRTQLGNLNLDQEIYSRVSTTEAYLGFCKDHGITPESVTLSSGTQAHWLGNKNAKRVLLWLHGTVSTVTYINSS